MSAKKFAISEVQLLQ